MLISLMEWSAWQVWQGLGTQTLVHEVDHHDLKIRTYPDRGKFL